jgi:hypothetical protein
MRRLVRIAGIIKFSHLFKCEPKLALAVIFAFWRRTLIAIRFLEQCRGFFEPV